MQVDPSTIKWLFTEDPAIRWQVQRDLLGKERSAWETERRKVAETDWGSRILSFQDSTVDGLPGMETGIDWPYS